MTTTAPAGGIPLDEYTSTVPPGWRPGMEGYPLRMYQDKLQMWWMQTDLQYAQVCALIAGRLKGSANTTALKLRLERPITAQPPAFDQGADALVRQSTAEIRDPQTGVVTQPYIPSGLVRLLKILQDRYGLDEQDTVGVALDHFFDYARTHQGLQEYINDFAQRYDDAEQKAGLSINAVGLSHLLLKRSGLSDKSKDDVKLQLGGRLDNYEALRTLLLRMARSPEKERLAYHGTPYHDDTSRYEE